MNFIIELSINKHLSNDEIISLRRNIYGVLKRCVKVALSPKHSNYINFYLILLIFESNTVGGTGSI
jgi:hypothetical protein